MIRFPDGYVDYLGALRALHEIVFEGKRAPPLTKSEEVAIHRLQIQQARIARSKRFVERADATATEQAALQAKLQAHLEEFESAGGEQRLNELEHQASESAAEKKQAQELLEKALESDQIESQLFNSLWTRDRALILKGEFWLRDYSRPARAGREVGFWFGNGESRGFPIMRLEKVREHARNLVEETSVTESKAAIADVVHFEDIAHDVRGAVREINQVLSAKFWSVPLAYIWISTRDESAVIRFHASRAKGCPATALIILEHRRVQVQDLVNEHPMEELQNALSHGLLIHGRQNLHEKSAPIDAADWKGPADPDGLEIFPVNGDAVAMDRKVASGADRGRSYIGLKIDRAQLLHIFPALSAEQPTNAIEVEVIDEVQTLLDVPAAILLSDAEATTLASTCEAPTRAKKGRPNKVDKVRQMIADLDLEGSPLTHQAMANMLTKEHKFPVGAKTIERARKP